MPDNVPDAHASPQFELWSHALVALADARVPALSLAGTVARLLAPARCVVMTKAGPGAPQLLFTTASEQPPAAALADETTLARWLRGRGYTCVEALPIRYGADSLGALVLALVEGPIEAPLRARASGLGRAVALRLAANRREADLRDAHSALVAATARASATKQLWQQATLAVGSVHNLGNLLGLISGLAELVAEQAPPAVRSDLEQIVRSAQDAGRLVRRVLAREDAGAAGAPALTDVARAIEDVLTLTRPIWGRNERVNVGMDFAPVPLAQADPADVREVLINLVLNAIAAMPEGGNLVLRSRLRAGQVAIEVVDTGHGIPRDQLGMIFEPAHTTRPGNAGMGLSISRTLIEQAGGRLSVESEPGRGSTFTITIPAAGSAGAQAATSTPRGMLDWAPGPQHGQSQLWFLRNFGKRSAPQN